MYPATRNTVLGAGYVYFDEYDEATAQYLGERYLANTPSLALAMEPGGEVKDYEADGEIAALDLHIFTLLDRTAEFTCKDMSAANMALFVDGDLSSISTTAGAVAADTINGGKGVLQGYWYQLGQSISAAGVRAITTLVIKDSVPTTYTLTDDYLADLTLGRIYIVPGGAIADDTVITADFAKTDVSWEQVAAARISRARRGRLRFVAGNTAGTNRDLWIPDCQLHPMGDIQWKSRDTVQQMGFRLTIQVPTAVDGAGNALAPVYINGRAVAA